MFGSLWWWRMWNESSLQNLSSFVTFSNAKYGKQQGSALKTKQFYSKCFFQNTWNQGCENRFARQRRYQILRIICVFGFRNWKFDDILRRVSGLSESLSHASRNKPLETVIPSKTVHSFVLWNRSLRFRLSDSNIWDVCVIYNFMIIRATRLTLMMNVEPALQIGELTNSYPRCFDENTVLFRFYNSMDWRPAA